MENPIFAIYLLSKNQTEENSHTSYLVWYIFTSVNLTDLKFYIKHELLPLILHFEAKKSIKNMPYDCNNNPKILNEYWITLQLWYTLMTSSVVLIYQQQKCVFATVWTNFNFFIAPELIIIEKSGRGNNI